MQLQISKRCIWRSDKVVIPVAYCLRQTGCLAHCFQAAHFQMVCVPESEKHIVCIALVQIYGIYVGAALSIYLHVILCVQTLHQWLQVEHEVVGTYDRYFSINLAYLDVLFNCGHHFVFSAVKSDIIVSFRFVVLQIDVKYAIVNEQYWKCVMLVTIIDVGRFGIV